jgi:hypothetical protein
MCKVLVTKCIYKPWKIKSWPTDLERIRHRNSACFKKVNCKVQKRDYYPCGDLPGSFLWGLGYAFTGLIYEEKEYPAQKFCFK